MSKQNKITKQLSSSACATSQCNFPQCACDLNTLERVVQCYLAAEAQSFEKEIQHFARSTWEERIKVAFDSIQSHGKMCPHQYRVGEKELKRLLIAAQPALLRELPKAQCFEDIHHAVEQACASAGFHGVLTIYDVSWRIAAFDRALMPQQVYLHSGAAAGAKVLWRASLIPKPTPVMPVSVFPETLQQLAPYHIENFLCIYASRLNR